MNKIEPGKVYTTKEARNYLKVSKSTIKRWLKKGIIKANKVGGRYRILGIEILRAVSPEFEDTAKKFYRKLKKKTKEKVKDW